MKILAFGGALALAACAGACLWDTDAVANENKRFPGAVEAITGWFDRNPALYYSMRLERVTKELQANPRILSLYDDAGVACTRLGLDVQAIAWMAKKLTYLKQAPAGADTKEQWYRYDANLGTFWVHHWFRSGSKRSRVDELRKGKGLLEQAMKINPEAHFGREFVQVLVIRWLINDAERTSGDAFHPMDLSLGTYLHTTLVGKGKGKGIGQKLLTGLTGLVALGDAWESYDVFEAICMTAGRFLTDGNIAYLALLRCKELESQGKGSMNPNSFIGADISSGLYSPQDREDFDQMFREWRLSAEKRNQHREAFMIKRLTAGRHPDTDSHFWEGYVDDNKPSMPFSREQKRERKIILWKSSVATCAAVLISIAIVFYWHESRKRRTRAS